MKYGKAKEHNTNSWIFLFLICIATCFMSIGYAAIDSIKGEISGTLLAQAQEGVFVTDMVYSSDVNAVPDNFKIESHGESVRKIQGENNEQINFYIQKMVERFEKSQYVTTMIQFDNALKQQHQGVNVYQNNMQQIQGRTVIEMNSIQPAAPIA